MPQVWLDGRLLDQAEASIAIGDRGFLLGDGLFETMRAYAGRVFRLGAHLARLRAGAERVGIPLPSDLEQAVLDTVAANDAAPAGDTAIRLTVTRGEAGIGLLPADAPPSTALVTARPYRPDPAWYERGISAGIARGRLDEHSATAGLKRLGYLEAIVAMREAVAAGYQDAIFLDSAGHLAEGAASNLFVVAGGELLTPPLSCGILPGITRTTVVELARRRALPVREAVLEPAVLAQASEAFLTSSLRELAPLVSVDGRNVGDGRPGPTTRALLEDYRRLVRAHEAGDA